MIAHNIFKIIFKPNASDRLVAIVVRISMVVVTAIGTAIALTLTSIYNAGIICADLTYAMVVPQMVLVLHFPKRCNKYGCIASFLVAAVLRCLCGESMLGLPVVIQLPLFADGRQHFPFRTAIMLISCITHLVVSHLFFLCFSKGWLDVKYDWLKCHQFVPRDRKLVAVPLTEPPSSTIPPASMGLLVDHSSSSS